MLKSLSKLLKTGINGIIHHFNSPYCYYCTYLIIIIILIFKI